MIKELFVILFVTWEYLELQSIQAKATIKQRKNLLTSTINFVACLHEICSRNYLLNEQLPKFTGGKNHMNDMRSDALKRFRASDSQLLTKENFLRIEADKCQSNNAMQHLKSGTSESSAYDQSPTNLINDYEQKSYLADNKSYYVDARGRPCDAYGVDGNNGISSGASDKNGATHENYSADYDDAGSLNGDSNKEYLVSSSSGSVNGDRFNASHRNLRRKHGKDDGSVDMDNNKVFYKMYKNNCGEAATIPPTKFDYMNSFDGIRARSLGDMQNDDQQSGNNASENDYRINVTDDMSNRCSASSDDNGANINVNYASSDDLNQTNTSEHDDKNMSGSDDEGGGKYFANNNNHNISIICSHVQCA